MQKSNTPKQQSNSPRPNPKKAARKHAGKKVSTKKTAARKVPGKKVAAKKFAAKKAARKVANSVLAKIKGNNPSFPLPKFVERINKLLPRFLPAGSPTDGRVTEAISPRNVRAYQNRGIIDAPEREGKAARYGYRHLLQALAARKLLADGFKVPQIVNNLATKTNEDLEKLLKRQAPASPGTSETYATAPTSNVGPWARVEVAPGLELNVARGFKFPKNPEARKALMTNIREAMKREMTRRRSQRQARKSA